MNQDKCTGKTKSRNRRAWEARLKSELQKTYQAPEPVGREAFLNSVKEDDLSVSTMKFMWGQIAYVNKWMWILSALLFAWMLLVGCSMEQENMVWISAATPFLALTVLMESAKSEVYRMSELEMATRFSLKSVLLARMGALAIIHGGIFVVMALCLESVRAYLPGAISNIMVPYFLTIYLGIYATRKFRNREPIIFCVGVPVLVSLVTNYSRALFPMLYRMEMQGWWILLLGVVVVLACREVFLFYRQTEELSWN